MHGWQIETPIRHRLVAYIAHPVPSFSNRVLAKKLTRFQQLQRCILIASSPAAGHSKPTCSLQFLYVSCKQLHHLASALFAY